MISGGNICSISSQPSTFSQNHRQHSCVIPSVARDLGVGSLLTPTSAAAADSAQRPAFSHPVSDPVRASAPDSAVPSDPPWEPLSPRTEFLHSNQTACSPHTSQSHECE